MANHVNQPVRAAITAMRSMLPCCQVPTISALGIAFAVLFTSSTLPGLLNGVEANELKVVISKPHHPQVWDRTITAFEKRTGIKIRLEIGPNSSTAAHALITQKLKNADPDLDIFLMDVTWPSEFASAGWIEPLDDFFPPEDQADFFSAAISACTVGGQIYGVPFETSGGLLYYRKDLLGKYGFHPPDTWEQLVEQAESITAREREHNPALKGYCGQFKQYEGLTCNMQEFILSNQGMLFNDDGKSTINFTPNLFAIQFVRDRIVGKVAYRGILTYEEPESLHVFVQGNAIFLRNWPYAWEIANNPERSRIAGNVGIAVLPHFSRGESAPALGGWQFALSRFSRKKDLAWRFVKHMTSPDVQKAFAIYSSQTPARRSVYNDPEVLRRNPHFPKLREAFDKARPRPAIPLYPLYSSILQSFYQRAIAYPHTHLEELAAEADKKVEQLLLLMRDAGM